MTLRILLPITLLVLTALLVTAGVVIARSWASPNAVVTLNNTFTYQGRLNDAIGAVTDTCDFRFGLFEAASLGSQIGSTQDVGGVSVADGLFSVPLDFGGGAFDGNDRYLEIEVRCPAGGGIFSKLSPRQPLTPSPYAIHAFTSPWSGLAGVPESIADGLDDDSLGVLACSHNEIPKWNDIAGEWQCSDPLAEVDENQQFTADGLFDVPDGVQRVQLEVWGAGGGGGDHGSGGLAGGGGGGGSGGYTRTLIDVTPGEQLTVDIGAGGAPGTDGGTSQVLRGAAVLGEAGGGGPGADGQDQLCAPDIIGAGGAGGVGGQGNTQNGNPGGDGGTGRRAGFPIVSCRQGGSGPGGAPVEGTIVPLGSQGGSGGGVFFPFAPQSPPGSGANGFVLFRW